MSVCGQNHQTPTRGGETTIACLSAKLRSGFRKERGIKDMASDKTETVGIKWPLFRGPGSRCDAASELGEWPLGLDTKA